jgi:hypothetical protein
LSDIFDVIVVGRYRGFERDANSAQPAGA